jgi:hypothetical protein
VQATVVDLRYHMNDVLKALDRNERVHVLYRGKTKGVICPADVAPAGRVAAHTFFGSRPSRRSVAQIMEDLRGGRHRGV